MIIVDINSIFPLLILLAVEIRTLYSIISNESFKPVDTYGQDLILLFFIGCIPLILLIITTLADIVNGN